MKDLEQILSVAYSAADPVSSGDAVLSLSEVTALTGKKTAGTRNAAGTDKLFFPQMTMTMMQMTMSAIIVIAHIIIR